MEKLLVLLIFVVLATPVAAEVQTYEDEYVSFQYDDEVEGFIDAFSFSGKSSVSYLFEADDLHCSLNLITGKEAIEESREQIQSGDFPAMCLDDGDGYLLYAISDKDGDCVFYQTLIETAKVSDAFEAVIEGAESYQIYRHYPYSEQALNYAKKAIEICNSYLEMSIDKKEAAKQIEEVENRAKAYSESTSDPGDKDVASALFLSSLKFSPSRDADVIELRNELQSILDGAI